MGNIGSSNINGRRRHSSSRRGHHHPPAAAPQPPQPEISPNQYVFAAATPYPAAQYNQNPNPNPHPYYHYPGYYPPAMPAPPPLPTPYDHHHRPLPPSPHVYPCGPMMPPPPRYVEHQKAVTIRNDVNLKKESLRVEKDEEFPGSFVVSFTFDATVPGSITIMFFAKEGEDCSLTSTKENMLAPVTVPFEQGLGQKFRQSVGTEIDFSMFDETELLKEGEMEVYPLVVKAEAILVNPSGSADNQEVGATNSQITKAVFEKEKGEYQVRVVKQILWVNSIRYELQEIYGIGNSVDNDFDGNDPGKECVICLSEPRDTTVLPCRHMCMCSGCAKLLGFQTNRCPICRQPVERLLEIKVNTGSED